MDLYCDVCDKFINPKSKIKHCESSTHEEFDKCKHMELTIENPDINNVDEVFYAYIIQHKKQYDHHLIKGHFKIVFKDNLYKDWIRSNLFNNKTMISGRKVFIECN